MFWGGELKWNRQRGSEMLENGVRAVGRFN